MENNAYKNNKTGFAIDSLKVIRSSALHKNWEYAARILEINTIVW